MKDSYVYIYLDPRKKGNYIYGSYSFEYEPFYVGKGKKDRLLYHLHETKENTINTLKYNIINKIKLANLEPIIIKIYDNLSAKKAFDLEKKIIKLIGRIDKNEGPLSNLTDGGRGRNNYKVSEYTKIKMKNSHIGLKLSEESKKKLSKSIRGSKNHRYGKPGTRLGVKLSDDIKEKMSNKKKKPVLQYDLNHNLIKRWDSVKEAKEYLGFYNIANCCRGLSKSAYGYIWKYEYPVAPSIKIIKK